MTHLTPAQVGLYLQGALTNASAADLDAHIDTCEACRELISRTVRERHHAELALAETTASASKPSLPAAVGDTIDGRYRVERLLGIGGMGCVFEAHHLALNQRVAVKLMLPELAKDRAAVDRFTREARAAVRLSSEHVGKVLDLGALADGTPYLVMELLLGESVDQRLVREGPMPRLLALDIICATLKGLEEAHGLGIIHRDLKPANLFLSRRSSGAEVLKVLDFGVAKSVHPDIEAGLGATTGAALVGSPLYMAPEQLAPGRVIDARVDLWAVGCTLYQLLSGSVPFREADLVELMYSIQTRPHVALTTLVPGVADVSAVIDACLEKDVTRRPATAAALRARLEALRSAPLALATSGSIDVRGLRSRWPVGVLTALAVVAAGVVVTSLFTSARTEPLPPAPIPVPIAVPVPVPVATQPLERVAPVVVEPVMVAPPSVVDAGIKRTKPRAKPGASQADVLDERL
ncbi:MAG: protein kinase [Myxococcales bacterium]|nr:protein kinase [Myxococcales bacterium]